MGNVKEPHQTVFIVDDNAGVRKALSEYLDAAGLNTEAFASAEEFLAAYDPKRSGCLILDLKMPGMSGLELQEDLLSKGALLPVIIVSGHAGVPEAVRSMKLGTFEFIEKPYSSEFLLQRIHEALAQAHRKEHESLGLAGLRTRFQLLTHREKEILGLVVSGKQSKVIASLVGLSVSTVDNHRANIMKKLQAETSADLTRIALHAEPALALLASDKKRRETE